MYPALAADGQGPWRDDDPRLQAQRHPTLFAALNVLTGEVTGRCFDRHRHEEFLKFLNVIDAQVPKGQAIHVILDNYATHKHADVQRWLRRHKRFHLHFIPTSSSWLNWVERWFRDLDGKALRRGSFNSVPDLIAAIENYLQANNEYPTPFVWTATAESILATGHPRPTQTRGSS